MDKKSLFWWYGHTLVETDLKRRFHGGDHAESWREGQDRVQTHIMKEGTGGNRLAKSRGGQFRGGLGHSSLTIIILRVWKWRGQWGLLARLHGGVGVEYRIDFRLARIYSVVMTDLKFEWDERKNHENQRKHGVSFEEARSVFYDQQAVEFYDDENEEMEDRFLLLGVSGRLRILMVCHCHRQNGDVIRIISARKATRNEEREYPWGAS